MDWLWDLGILKLLMQHHSMPSTPQGESPAEKFLGQCMHMSFAPAGSTKEVYHRIDAVGISIAIAERASAPTRLN